MSRGTKKGQLQNATDLRKLKITGIFKILD